MPLASGGSTVRGHRQTARWAEQRVPNIVYGTAEGVQPYTGYRWRSRGLPAGNFVRSVGLHICNLRHGGQRRGKRNLGDERQRNRDELLAKSPGTYNVRKDAYSRHDRSLLRRHLRLQRRLAARQRLNRSGSAIGGSGEFSRNTVQTFGSANRPTACHRSLAEPREAPAIVSSQIAAFRAPLRKRRGKRFPIVAQIAAEQDGIREQVNAKNRNSITQIGTPSAAPGTSPGRPDPHFPQPPPLHAWPRLFAQFLPSRT